MITVISQSTAERNQETISRFEKIRPFLDEGHTYRSACIKSGLITNASGITNYAWFKELIKYGTAQGYDYKEYKYRRMRV